MEQPLPGKPGPSKSPIPDPEKVDKQIEKVVTGEVIQRKPPLAQRVKNIFFSGDVHSVGKYIMSEVLLPALRNLVVDSTTKGIERMIYGDTMAPRHAAGRPRYSYNNPVRRDNRPDTRPRAYLPDQPPLPGRVPRNHNIGDLVVSSRAEGELVIERMQDILENYNVVSVADMLDLIGLPNSYIDNKWGWTELVYADVRQVRDGFLLDLPPAEPI